MVDARKCFKNGYLCKVHKSNASVSCIHGIAHNTSSEITSLKTPKADAFLDSLELDSLGILYPKSPLMVPVTQFFQTNITSLVEEKVKEKCWLC